MQRVWIAAAFAAVVMAEPAFAQSNMGGGFIEFVFGDRQQQPRYQAAPAPQGYAQPQYQQPQYQQPQYQPPQRYQVQPAYGQQQYIQPQQPYQQQEREPYPLQPGIQQPAYQEPRTPMYQAPRQQRATLQPPAQPLPRAMDPKFQKQEVAYDGPEKPGTIIINTPERLLYLVQEDGKAMRYGIGVGRPGFTWAGEHKVTDKKVWPDWRPPDEMIKRQPYLPRHMPGGPNNPLGARAMYLGNTLYRIHGSNEPWTIGSAVSSGCIRMRNEDVVDLYNRVPVGTKVIVI